MIIEGVITLLSVPCLLSILLIYLEVGIAGGESYPHLLSQQSILLKLFHFLSDLVPTLYRHVMVKNQKPVRFMVCGVLAK